MVKVFKQLDYAIPVPLCLHHKHQFRRGDTLLDMDLKAYGGKELLGKEKDIERKNYIQDTLDFMQKQAKADNREEVWIF